MHAYVRGVPRVCVCMHACVDWYGLEMVRTYVDVDMAGARQNMRVRIPSMFKVNAPIIEDVTWCVRTYAKQRRKQTELELLVAG